MDGRRHAEFKPDRQKTAPALLITDRRRTGLKRRNSSAAFWKAQYQQLLCFHPRTSSRAFNSMSPVFGFWFACLCFNSLQFPALPSIQTRPIVMLIRAARMNWEDRCFHNWSSNSRGWFPWQGTQCRVCSHFPNAHASYWKMSWSKLNLCQIGKTTPAKTLECLFWLIFKQDVSVFLWNRILPFSWAQLEFINCFITLIFPFLFCQETQISAAENYWKCSFNYWREKGSFQNHFPKTG